MASIIKEKFKKKKKNQSAQEQEIEKQPNCQP